MIKNHFFHRKDQILNKILVKNKSKILKNLNQIEQNCLFKISKNYWRTMRSSIGKAGVKKGPVQHTGPF